MIVGAGVLGRLIAHQWRQLHPDSVIVGETLTTRSHNDLQSLNITPALVGMTSTSPRVVFCAPPSKSVDYGSLVAQATQRVSPNGRFIFTSSSGICGSVPIVSERSPACDVPRMQRLKQAEQATLSIPQGLVVRLAGLYTTFRGPHTYWLNTGNVSNGPDGLLNLLHYEDAASIIVRMLSLNDEEMKALGQQRTFLAAVADMISRRDVLEAALQHPEFDGMTMPTFGNIDDGKGDRQYDSKWTRETLQWTPKWENMGHFLRNDASRVTAAAAGADGR